MHYKKNKLNKSKRSQSGLITVILIILLVLAAIVVVWNVVYGLIKKSSSEVQVDTMINRIDVASTKFYLTGGAFVNVKSNANVDINKVKIILTFKDGSSKSLEKDVIIKPMETIPIFINQAEINYSSSKIVSVSVIPIFGSKLGLEAKEITPRLDLGGDRILDSPSGLISWWKFDGDLTDSVGGNHGTCTNCPQFTQDRKGKENAALRFDGIYNSIAIANKESISFNKTQDYAIGTWIKLKSHNITVDTIIEKWRGSEGSYSYVMRIVPTTEHVYCAMYAGYNGSKIISFGADSSTGIFKANSDWHFIFCNFDNSNNNISLWIDGVLNNSRVYSPALLNGRDIKNNDDVYLGSRDTWYHFNGEMDNAVIFNRTLSDDEIKGIYLNQK